MVVKVNSVLREVLLEKNVPKEEMKEIKIKLDKFLVDVRKAAKSLKVKVDVFVGGSYAKKTMIKKGDYDIDIFMRFDKGYEEKEFSILVKKILDKVKGIRPVVIHGSRDYFRVNSSDNLFFEIIPVKKVNNPKDAENITDLSYSHVKYVNRKVKSQKILDEIKIAKAFCYAKKCYGAESYIKGFSGYGLELLVYHCGSFMKFAREILKVDSKKRWVIDLEKHYRNRNLILMDLNESKLKSPIVLIDPTFKTRNVLAALSEETLEKFKSGIRNFLKNPSIKDFRLEEIDFNEAERKAKGKKQDFIFVRIGTVKQEGDIAGSKLLKFYNHLKSEVERFFDVKDCGFEYPGEGQSGRFFLSVKKRGDILVGGPDLKDEKNVKRFEEGHKITFKKGKRIYAREKVDFSLKDFFNKWEKKNVKKVGEMSVSGLEVSEG